MKPPKMSHQLEPGGSGLGAVRACLTSGWATPGLVTTAGSGGHGESLRRSRGDAAGVQPGSSFVNRRSVNTGTVPALATGRATGADDRAGSTVGRSGRDGAEPP